MFSLFWRKGKTVSGLQVFWCYSSLRSGVAHRWLGGLSFCSSWERGTKSFFSVFIFPFLTSVSSVCRRNPHPTEKTQISCGFVLLCNCPSKELPERKKTRFQTQRLRLHLHPCECTKLSLVAHGSRCGWGKGLGLGQYFGNLSDCWCDLRAKRSQNLLEDCYSKCSSTGY